jgi:hypothetical protein
MKTTRANRGSVILLVVGLLTIISLLGSTFLLVSNLDRRQSRAVASGTPMDGVAEGVLGMLIEERLADLHVSNTGTPANDRPYSDAATLTDIGDLIDFPHETTDPALATIDADATATPGLYVWPHVTNIGDADAVTGTFVNLQSNTLVDTDADGIGDAVLWPTGTTNANGEEYYVAVRMIDTCGLLNVNTAGVLPNPATLDYPMPPSDISAQAALEYLGVPIAAAPGIASQLHVGNGSFEGRRGNTTLSIVPASPGDPNWNTSYTAQVGDPEPAIGTYFLPFDSGDLIAMRMRTDPTTANMNRLYWLFSGPAGYYNVAKRYLTTYSASRDYVPRPIFADGAANQRLEQSYKADLNALNNDSLQLQKRYDMLFRAFYNAVPSGVPTLTDTGDDAEKDRRRKLLAAQLAVNVIDYTDTNDEPTEDLGDPTTGGDLFDPTGATAVQVFGVEKQPVLTKAFLRWHWDGPTSTRIRHIAFEIHNPYEESWSKVSLRFLVDGADAGSVMVDLGPRGKAVIADALPPGDISDMDYAAGVTPMPLANLLGVWLPNLNEEIVIQRDCGGGIYVAIARIDLSDFALAVTEGPLDVETDYAAFRRDDNPSHAKYTIATTVFGGPEPVGYCTDLGDTDPDDELGGPNDPAAHFPEDADPSDDPVKPVPVYVRNGPFINVGELARIFFIGPREDLPLDEQLATVGNGCDPIELDNGRLPFQSTSPLNPGGGYDDGMIPLLPLGMMLAEHFTANSPLWDKEDNDGDDTQNGDEIDEKDLDGGEDIVYGRININTAPPAVLAGLPGLSALTPAQRQTLMTVLLSVRRAGTPAGFDAAGEAGALVSSLLNGMGITNNDYPATEPENTAPGNYAFENLTGVMSDDGLSADSAGGIAVANDLTKAYMPYAWWSNHVTVRSDTYLAFIRVQVGGRRDETRYRRYLALIDRSNCRATGDRPQVRIFARLR